MRRSWGKRATLKASRAHQRTPAPSPPRASPRPSRGEQIAQQNEESGTGIRVKQEREEKGHRIQPQEDGMGERLSWRLKKP